MNMKKTLSGMGLATIWLLCAPAMAGETKTATIRPDQPNPDPTPFEDVQPEDTVYFNVNIVTPAEYTFSHTGWDRSRSNPNFLWTRITDMNSKLVNTAWESGTTTVNSHGYWNGGEGGGSGEGGDGLIHRWATGVASAGDALGPDLVVKISPDAAGVGNGVSGSAFGTRVSDGGEVAVKANWSVSAPGYFKSGHTDTHSVQFSRDTAGEAQVTAVNNGPPQRSGSGSAMFVEVVSISADPATVCMGTTQDFTLTTSPGGYTNLVDIAFNPNVPGAQEVIATCGSSSASTWVTVVGAASLSCNGITSETPDPGPDETVYVYAGTTNDAITFSAALDPEADPGELEGRLSWQNAEPLEENPLAAEFPIDTPSSSAEGTVVTFSCGTSQVAIRVVVVAINLSYNGLPEETEEEPNEEEPGGFITMNDNDNAGGESPGQGNGTPDINDDTPLPHPDSDLKPITLSLMPADMTNGTLTLSVPGVLKVWGDAKKTNTVVQWDLAASEEMPGTLYLEGYSTGSGDLTLSYSGVLSCSDSVKMTVFKVDLSMEEYLGIDLTDTTNGVDTATASVVVSPAEGVTNYLWTLTGAAVFTNDVKQTNTTSTSVTVFETGEASSAYKGDSISVQALPFGWSAQTNFTVVKADIVWPDLVETNEEILGAWVKYNGDDDDTNGVVDAEQGAMENGIEDDDLVEIELNLDPGGLPTNETVTVACEGCWLDRMKQTNAAGEFVVTSFPMTVYVEGQTISQSNMDRSITMLHPASGAKDKVKYTVLKVEFVHAEGDHEGEPMDYLPIFRPSSGANAGVPTYSSPSPDLILTFNGPLDSSSTDSISVAYLGTDYVTTETGTNNLEFCDSNNVVSVTLLDSPLADTNVQEELTAIIDLPTDGVSSAKYECIETTASSLNFVNSPRGIVMSISDLTSLTNDTMHFKMAGTLVQECDPVETDSNSLTFVAGNLTVGLLDDSTLTTNTDMLLAAISDAGQLSNTVFTLQETGPTTRVFRNHAEPTPTSIADTTVPAFVSWQVKIHGISDFNLLTSFVLNSSVETNDQLTFTTVASLLSDQKVIVIPQSVDPADVPAGYSFLKVDDTDLDWNDSNAKEVTGDIQLVAMASPARVVQTKVQADAVVLQSLDFLSSVGQGLDPETLIRSPFLDMGYSAIRDYHAKKSDTLTKYVKGKQVWYSMSHGGTQDGTPYSEFIGLVFKDGGIKASDIQGLGLKYRLVVVDGCCSAQTSTSSRDEAKTSNTLTTGAQTFADAFGPDAAYMGWGWEMNPRGAQAWSTVFVNNLKYQSSLGRGRTVQEAYDKFIQDYYVTLGLPAAKYMKIYRNTGNVIELRKSP